MDSLLRLGAFSPAHLLAQLPRFRRYRGVLQLRSLAPLAGARAQSLPESIVRLRWLDLGYPDPVPQVEEAAPLGSYFIDVGNRDYRVGAEYLGAEFHDDEHAAYDEERIASLRGARRWTIIELRNDNLFGPQANFDVLLERAFRDAAA